MKKLIYIVALFVVCAMTATSCTEQEVKPKGEPIQQ
jgi:predicted small secreted protein